MDAPLTLMPPPDLPCLRLCYGGSRRSLRSMWLAASAGVTVVTVSSGTEARRGPSSTSSAGASDGFVQLLKLAQRGCAPL